MSTHGSSQLGSHSRRSEEPITAGTSSERTSPHRQKPPLIRLDAETLLRCAPLERYPFVRAVKAIRRASVLDRCQPAATTLSPLAKSAKILARIFSGFSGW